MMISWGCCIIKLIDAGISCARKAKLFEGGVTAINILSLKGAKEKRKSEKANTFLYK